MDVVESEEGTNRRALLRLTYREGGAGSPSGPPTVFVKMHGRWLHRLALLALRAWSAEARLAGAHVDLPLEHPRPYGGAFDRRRLEWVVVVDDVANRGGAIARGTEPLSVARVRSGLAGLARLHARYWDRPLPQELAFLRPWQLGGGWAPVSALSLARGCRRLRDAQDGTTVAQMPAGTGVRQLERQFRRSALLASHGPQTVLHGDAHPANTYAVGGVTGFLDWQLVRTGSWSHDVGYFVAGSLDPPDRRRHEQDLLRGYLEDLARAGVDPSAGAPTWADAWERYRAAPAFGLATWLHTIGAGSFQPLDICLRTIERYAAAYEDLETSRSLVGDLGSKRRAP